MCIATAVGAFLVRAVVLLLATFRFGVTILVAVVTVLGMMYYVLRFVGWTIVTLQWVCIRQRRLEGTACIQVMIVVHDGFFEDVYGHVCIDNGGYC